MRSLVKAGDPAALAVLGYGADSPARVGEAKMLTRTHYPGQHNVDVLANRIAVAVGSFTPTA